MARSANAMSGVGGGLGKFTELRSRLLFVVGALIVYRIGCYIPVPGVNPDAMLELMKSQEGTIVDMFNMFSGGALERFSLFALNVVPYISASIIVQLLVQIVPTLKAIQKEGESGRRRITQWSRIGAIPLAVFQAAGIATALQASGANNAIRELGGVFGVAVLASVFAASGSYVSPQAFSDGLRQATLVGAIVVAIGALVAFRVPVATRSPAAAAAPAES